MSQLSESRLRIVLLTSIFAPYTIASGIGELYACLATGLSKAGHEVTVLGIGIHPESSSEHTWGRILSLPLTPKRRFVPRPIQDAFEIAYELRKRDGDFDVLDCTSAPNISALIYNPRLAVVVRAVTSVMTERDRPLTREIICMFLLEWIALMRATTVFISTEYILKRTRTLYRLKLKNVVRVPLGVSEVPLPETRSNRPTRDLRLLIVASAGKRKGTDVLIRALSAVSRASQDFEVTFVEPPWGRYETFVDRDPVLRALWRELADVLGTKFKVLTQISHAQKLDLFAEADYLIMTSRSESFGIPVIEAMRAGLPVISSRCGALAEVAGASPETLFYEDPEDWTLLATLLQKVVSAGPEAADRRRLASRQAFEDKYTENVLVYKSLRGYRAAISQRLRKTSQQSDA